MDLYLNNVDKKINSTKVINTGWTSITTSCKLKENTNLTKPTFKLSRSGIATTSFPAYNYLKLVENNKTYYYFINSWEAGNDGCWYLDCTMDVLATFKTDILSKSLYVLRSASNYNLDIIDTTYNNKLSATTYSNYPLPSQNVSIKDVFTNSTPVMDSIRCSDYFNRGAREEGFYYVRVATDISLPGSGDLYVMRYGGAGWIKFTSELYNLDKGSDFTGIAPGVARNIANVTQYILDAYWLPFCPAYLNETFSTNVTIPVGPYGVPGITCSKIYEDYSHAEITFGIDMPSHSQASSRGNYLNIEPYTRRKLYFYPFGVFNISHQAIAEYDNPHLLVHVYCDILSGEAILRVVACNKVGGVLTEGVQVAADVKNYRVSIPVTEKDITLVGAAGGTIREITYVKESQEDINKKASYISEIQGPAASQGYKVGTALRQAASNIGDMFAQSETSVNTTGTYGSFQSFSILPRVETVCFEIVNEDLDHNGRPLCEVKTLSTLSGYCLCKDNEIGISGCSSDQLEMIMNYLTSGFFIE